MTVRAFVLIDRHGSARLAPSPRDTRRRGFTGNLRPVASPHVKRTGSSHSLTPLRLLLVASLLVALARPGRRRRARDAPANRPRQRRRARPRTDGRSASSSTTASGSRPATPPSRTRNGASVLGGARADAGPCADDPASRRAREGRVQRSLEHRLRRRAPRGRTGRVRRRARRRRPPAPCSGASAGLGWISFALRALYYLGLLAGAGAAVFGFAMRGIASGRLRRPLAHLIFFSLLATFLGASAIVHAAPPGTRYALVLKVALTISLVGGAAAALAPTYPALLAVAGASAIALLAAPTLSGHALDRDQPRGLAAARRPRTLDVGGGVVRRPARPRVRRAERRRRVRAPGDRAPLLDDRARLRDRARR